MYRWLYLAILAVSMSCSLPNVQLVPQLPPLATAPVRVATVFKSSFHCSGVMVHNNWALTAAHCIDNDMWVNNQKVQDFFVPSPEWDMAIVHVPGVPSPNDVVWTDHKPVVGEPAILVGWGCSSTHTFASAQLGHVVSIDDRDLTYDVPVCPGDSGGPVFDMQGRLIGLVVRMVYHNHNGVVQYLAE